MTPEIIFQSKLDELNLQLNPNPNYPEEGEITVSDILEYIGEYYQHIIPWNDKVDEWIRDTQENYPGYLVPKPGPGPTRRFQVVMDIIVTDEAEGYQVGDVYNLIENTIAENTEDVKYIKVTQVIDRGRV